MPDILPAAKWLARRKLSEATLRENASKDLVARSRHSDGQLGFALIVFPLSVI